MTLLELQNILGATISKITDESLSKREHDESLTNAEYIAKIAKQMINNADIILRSEKLIDEGKLKESTIEQMIK